MEEALHLLFHSVDYGHDHYKPFSRHLGDESYGFQLGKSRALIWYLLEMPYSITQS